MKAPDTYLHGVAKRRKTYDLNGLTACKAEFSQTLANTVCSRDGVNTSLLFGAEVGKCFHVLSTEFFLYFFGSCLILNEIDNQFHFYKQAPLNNSSAPVRNLISLRQLV